MKVLLYCSVVLVFTACSLLGIENKKYDPEIVFSAEDKNGVSQIYTMNADGSNVTKLTKWKDGEESVQPSWSPNGKEIIFSSFRRSTSIGPAMWVMKADGSNKRPLKEYEVNGESRVLLGNNPKWNPDGTKVVYDLCLNCQLATNYDIYMYDTLKDEVMQLTQSSASDTSPRWSPDGTKIAFVSNRDYVEADTLRFRKDLYVMNSDGSNLKRLTESGFPRSYSWITSSRIIISEMERETNSKNIFELNTITNEENPILEEREFKNLLWVFWSSEKNQLIVLNKDFEELPLIITQYNYNKEALLLKEEESFSKKLKTAINFDLYENQ